MNRFALMVVSSVIALAWNCLPVQAQLPVTDGLACWFDAGVGVTVDGSATITTWTDQSGNGHDATFGSGTPKLVANQLNGRPAAQFRGSYLNVAGTLFAKEQYVVVRSPTLTWSGGGAFFARKTLRPSGYNMAGGSTTFYPAESPVAVSRNGAVVYSEGQGNSVFNIAPITNYMILKIVVNDGNTAPTTYTIANADTGTLQCDIAEIIGYTNSLSASNETAIGSYLATKYGLITAYPDATPQGMMKAFGQPGKPAVIDQAAKTIAWTVPTGTVVTALAPTFTMSSNATCDHVSGTTYNFTSPVHYIVKSSDNAISNDYTVTVTVDPQLSALPVGSGLACWYDAGVGVQTDGGGTIQYWSDLSGNGLHAIPLYGSVTTNAPGQINGRPVAQFRGGYLGCGHPNTTIMQQFVVFRSLMTPWAGGAVFGRRGANPERSYLFSCNPNALGFDQDPGWGSFGWVAANGTWVPQGTQVGRNAYFMTNDITQYMVFRLNMLRTGSATYQIGRCSDYSWPGGDVAEIIAYTNVLSTADEKLVGAYLANKYRISGAFPPVAPTGLTAASPATGVIALNWTAAFGATGYKVKHSLTSGTETNIGTASTTNYNDSAITMGMRYYYVVTSTNIYGESANSIEVSAVAPSPGLYITVR